MVLSRVEMLFQRKRWIMVSSKAPGASLQVLFWFVPRLASERFVRERDVIWHEVLRKDQGVKSLKCLLLPHKRWRERARNRCSGGGRWCSGNGGCMLLVLLDEIIFVGEHTVATIDIAPGEWLWRLLYDPFAYLWLMSARGVEPRFWQGVCRFVDP